MSAKVMSNLESIGDMVGYLKGLADGLDDDLYMEAVIKEAHSTTAHAFDIAAAATAATGKMTHVFEFGVPGITRGVPKYPDPTQPEARLWKHELTGAGGNQDIAYTFRPALNRNPQPTTRYTGVPSKYLQKLSRRKYIFWNKAFVMETGMTVEITPKNGNLLFIPFYGEPAMDGSGRSFMMFPGNAQLRPGRSTKGTFTAFWMTWWGGVGAEMMEDEMTRIINIDIEKYEREAAKKAAIAARQMKPPAATNLMSASKKAKAWGAKAFGWARKSKNVVTT